MASVVRNLFQIRSQSFFDPNIVSLGVLPSICEAIHRHELFNYFESWFSNAVFPSYAQWKAVVKSKIKMFEENAWSAFVLEHPSFDFAKSCLELVPSQKFWSISSYYPDLVCRLHVQIRLMGNFGLNTSIPWATTTDSTTCFICKEGEETLHHFLFDCTGFREHFDLLWSSLSTKVISSNPTDGNHMSDFLVNLEQHQKALLLVGCLPLPFDSATIMMITRFVASAVGKIYKLRTEKLRELEARWIAK